MIKTVKINDMEMDYAVFGNGAQPFVIIPGLSLHSVMLSADMVEARYATGGKSHTTYLIDRRKNAPLGYSIEEMAEDTAALMKSTGISHAHIFAASQGGMIAQCIASAHPELVSRLVLGSTLARTNPTSQAVIGHWVSLAQSKSRVELVTDILNKIYSENTLKKYRDILIESFGDISDDELQQFAVMAKAAAGFSAIDKIPEIKCPALVLGSRGDKVTTAEGSMELAKALGCDIYLYGDAYGHGVYDEAEDYPARIFDFFNK